MPDSGSPDDNGLQLNAVYEVMNPTYRDEVVSRALGFRGQLSSDANIALNAAIQKSRIRVTGYRDPLRAPHTLLRDPISQTLDFQPELAGAVLRAWAESQQMLHDKIVEHLQEAGLEAEYPDFQAGKFRRRWSLNGWHSQRDKFVRGNVESNFSEDDAALMLCYVTGRVPTSPKEGELDEIEGSLADYLEQFLDFLKAMPATAPEWRQGLPFFIESVSSLVQEKESELKWADDFDTNVQSVRAEFSEMLEFFEQDTERWKAARVSPGSESAAALHSVEKLRSLFADYRPIHDRAPGISEERERIFKRDELLPVILETIQVIDNLMTDEAGYPDRRPPAFPELRSADERPTTDILEASAQVTPAHGHDSIPATSLHEAFSIPDPSHAGHPGLNAEELSALQSENYGLRDDASALRSENQDLRDEVEALRTELFSSQEMEESWRMAYRSVMDGSLEEQEEVPLALGSVSEAVEMARSSFRQELLFSPNSESNVESNPYIYPNKVWEALQWLANIYYPSKLGRLRITDFDQSIREACGWWYKGDQGETTLSRYEKSYTTRVDGKRYWLAEHIGKGTSFDARYTIRIAFDWDRERRQVIVGYIGRHQQTDAS